MTGWQDMSTAPRDGTEILGRWPRPLVAIVVRFEDDQWWPYVGSAPVDEPAQWRPLGGTP